MLHQVEFLIEGNLLPMTMGELRVSEKLLFEQAWLKESESLPSWEQKSYTLVYVAVEAPRNTNYFLIARDYLDFFLLIYSLVSNQPVTSRVGVGTNLENINFLGDNRVGFPSFEKVHFVGEHKNSLLSRSILEAKELFLSLVPNKQEIMESSLGLALVYYYYAVLASRRRLEEVIINLVIAGEALLISDNTKIMQKLSRRLSRMIAETGKERTEIAKKMRKLYGLRCGIVHGGKKKPSTYDVGTLFDYIKRAIKKGLTSREFEKMELIAKLDKK